MCDGSWERLPREESGRAFQMDHGASGEGAGEGEEGTFWKERRGVQSAENMAETSHFQLLFLEIIEPRNFGWAQGSPRIVSFDSILAT